MWRKIFQYKKIFTPPNPLNTLIKKLYSDCPFWKQYLEYEYAKHARKNFYWYAMQIVFSCQLHYLIFQALQSFPHLHTLTELLFILQRKTANEDFFHRIVFFSYKSHLINTQQNIDSSFFVLKVTSCLFLLSLQQASKYRPLFAEFLSFYFGADLFLRFF